MWGLLGGGEGVGGYLELVADNEGGVAGGGAVELEFGEPLGGAAVGACFGVAVAVLGLLLGLFGLDHGYDFATSFDDRRPQADGGDEFAGCFGGESAVDLVGGYAEHHVFAFGGGVGVNNKRLGAAVLADVLAEAFDGDGFVGEGFGVGHERVNGDGGDLGCFCGGFVGGLVCF